MPPADNDRSSACRHGSACCPRKRKSPSRPRRDCPADRSGQRDALSESDRAHSRRRKQSKAAVCNRKCRRCHLRPSDRHGSGRVRVGNNSRHRHSRCNPPAPCPTVARSGTGPKGASVLRDGRSARRVVVRRSWSTKGSASFQLARFVRRQAESLRYRECYLRTHVPNQSR